MAYVLFLGGVAVAVAGLAWFASWAKRRGRGSGIAGAPDDLEVGGDRAERE